MGSESRLRDARATGSPEGGVAGLLDSPTVRGRAEPGDGHGHATDHLALLYDDTDEQLAVVAAFVEQGLDRGERCVYVVDDNDRSTVLEGLDRHGIDVDAALESGALTVHSPAETYRRTGEFDRDAMLAFWEGALADATEVNDFAGLRAAAEMTWALDDETDATRDDAGAEALAAYEAVLNDLYEGEDYAVCCQYNAERFPAPVLRDVVRTHPFVVEGTVLHDNVFYTPPREFFGPVPAEVEVERMLDTLRDRTGALAELEDAVERLQQSHDRVTQFAYAASHDLQEPLRMVSSYLRLLERRHADDLGADAREFVDYAVDGADRMRAMVDDLMVYARIAGRETSFEPVDCEALFGRVIDDLRDLIEERDAEVAVGDLPTVAGDPDLLEQLFHALLSNALTYSGDEPPRVEVTASECEAAREIAVADEGIGIDPDRTDRIFEVFGRLHHEAEYSGTGIGLALCQEIVEHHGGDIRVDSTPGEGSTFSVTLPRHSR